MNREGIDTLIIDGDIVAYRTAVTLEDTHKKACEQVITETLAAIKHNSGIQQARIYLSDETNFRYAIATSRPYKERRAKLIRPAFLPYCKEFLQEKYSAVIVKNVEADDAVVSDMTQTGQAHCGIDKDIQQCSGWHYNYVKKEWVFVSKEQAVLNLYRQVLTGDSSDDIPGLPQVGPKTAEKIVTDDTTAEQDAKEHYAKVYTRKIWPKVDQTDLILEQAIEDYFMEQFTLIKLRTSLDLTFKNTIVLPTTNVQFTQKGTPGPSEIRL